MTPKLFNECIKNKDRAVTKSLKGNKHVKIYYDKDTKSYTGEIKLKKETKAFRKTKAKKEKSYIKRAKAQVKDLLRLKSHFDKNNRN